MTSRALCRAEELLANSRSIGPVLGIDTGSSIASIALVTDGRVAGEVSRPVTSHGAALPGAVDELLKTLHLHPADLAAIAVGIGPGSFTGLRIGLSYAKGLTFALGAKIVGIPSLDAIALAALGSPAGKVGLKVCAIVDARKEEAYAALYEIVSNGLEKITQDVVMPLARLISHIPQGTILAGDYLTNDAATLAQSQGLQVRLLEYSAMNSCGRNVAALGAARVAIGESDSVDKLEPLYVRPPDAVAPGRQMRTEDVWSAERKNSFGSI